MLLIHELLKYYFSSYKLGVRARNLNFLFIINFLIYIHDIKNITASLKGLENKKAYNTFYTF